MQSQFSETDLEAKHKRIYVVVPLSVGPVGPGGGVYSIVEVVVYKVYLKKIRFGSQTIMDTFSFAYVCGPCRAQRWGIFNCRGCCVQIYP